MQQMTAARRALLGLALFCANVSLGCGGNSEPAATAPSLLATPRRLENLKVWANPADEGAAVLERWKNAATRLDMREDSLKQLGRARLSGQEPKLCSYGADVRAELHYMLDDLYVSAQKLACTPEIVSAVEANLATTERELPVMKREAKNRAFASGEFRHSLFFLLAGEEVPIRATRNHLEVRREIAQDVERVAGNVIERSGEVKEVLTYAATSSSERLGAILKWFAVKQGAHQPRCVEAEWALMAALDDPSADRFQTQPPDCTARPKPPRTKAPRGPATTRRVPNRKGK